MNRSPAHAYAWVHSTETGFVCDHCGQTRSCAAEMTIRDFQREAYDFLLRHKHCRPAERVH